MGLLILISCSDGQILSSAPSSAPEIFEQDHHPSVSIEDEFYFVHLEAGVFDMGSPAQECGRSNNEMQHEVHLTHDFYLSAFEVTKEQFFDFMPEADFGSSLCEEEGCPVEFITWHQAAAYTSWLSKKNEVDQCYLCQGEGRAVQCIQNPEFRDVYDCHGYRLPTEAEWEYAARSDTNSAIWTPLGGGEIPEGFEHSCDSEWTFEDGTSLTDWSWYCGNSDGPNPVGSKIPNDFGLYDMNGNVWEWTHDSFYEYSAQTEYNPTIHNQFDMMALRGGRWGNEPYALRSSKRIHVLPHDWDGSFGFRILYFSP